MDDADKLAVATLAAGRCAALGKHGPADYVAAYAEIERLFQAYREAENDVRVKGIIDTFKHL